MVIFCTTAAGCGGSGDDDDGAAGKTGAPAAILVPGGSFNRSNDPMWPATVSPFYLDKLEVSVGRFRAFVNAGLGTQASPPAAGAGAHPLIAGTGWDSTWNASLTADTTALKAALAGIGNGTWTDAAGANEGLPMNYVTWFEAFAFCAWDGGRLPTEAEWNFAAAGGDEQRLYPWGSAEPDLTRASYGCIDRAGPCPFTDITPVGSKPTGNARWGHADMAGNVGEWCFDWTPFTTYLMPCNDCADATSGVYRAIRGGDYFVSAPAITTEYRGYNDPTTRVANTGVRCARAKP